MMLTFRPIQNWPDGWQDPKERPNTPFRASYDATLKLLDDSCTRSGSARSGPSSGTASPTAASSTPGSPRSVER